MDLYRRTHSKFGALTSGWFVSPRSATSIGRDGPVRGGVPSDDALRRCAPEHGEADAAAEPSRGRCQRGKLGRDKYDSSGRWRRAGRRWNGRRHGAALTAAALTAAALTSVLQVAAAVARKAARKVTRRELAQMSPRSATSIGRDGPARGGVSSADALRRCAPGEADAAAEPSRWRCRGKAQTGCWVNAANSDATSTTQVGGGEERGVAGTDGGTARPSPPRPSPPCCR
jgi:hypothetical protein